MTVDRYYNVASIGFDVGWEMDFWGRFRRLVESASATLDASVASYDGALVTLVSQVAQNYILIRAFQDRVDVARERIQQYRIRETRSHVE